MESNVIKWGILGAGNIAHRFAESLENSNDSYIEAISVRDPEKGKEFSEKFKINKVYTHEELLEDENIDAIYISLPHQLHKEWTIKALESNKPVLLEKPAALNKEEVEEIIKSSDENNTLFMEAMKSRFTPAYKELKRFIDSGEIGEIKRIATAFSNNVNFNKNNKTYHTDKIAGGSLLDVGSYCAAFLLDFLGDDFKVEKTNMNIKNNVDYFTKSILDFNGKRASLQSGFDRDLGSRAVITGSKGKIVIDNLHRPEGFDVIKDHTVTHYSYPYEVDDFYSEIKEFENLLLANKKQSDLMSHQDSIKVAEILDEIRNNYQNKN